MQANGGFSSGSSKGHGSGVMGSVTEARWVCEIPAPLAMGTGPMLLHAPRPRQESAPLHKGLMPGPANGRLGVNGRCMKWEPGIEHNEEHGGDAAIQGPQSRSCHGIGGSTKISISLFESTGANLSLLWHEHNA